MYTRHPQVIYRYVCNGKNDLILRVSASSDILLFFVLFFVVTDTLNPSLPPFTVPAITTAKEGSPEEQTGNIINYYGWWAL